MHNLYAVSNADVMSFAKRVNVVAEDEFEYVMDQKSVQGVYREKIVKSDNYEIRDIRGDFNQNLKVDFEDAHLDNNFNICMCMTGTGYEVRFDTNKIRSRLSPARYHFNYIPDSRYQLILPRKVHSVHMALNNRYYTDLLHAYNIEADDLLKRFSSRAHFNSADLPASVAMRNIFAELFHTPLTGPIRNLYVESKVLEIVALQLSQGFKTTETPTALRRNDVSTFHDLKDYLDNTLSENHSLKALATEFGVNEFKLKKGFREVFGTTVFGYLIDKRLTFSKALLQEGGFTVNEVASKVGYKNANHFSTAFKEKFGISPKVLKG